jgi:asparagine synthase
VCDPSNAAGLFRTYRIRLVHSFEVLLSDFVRKLLLSETSRQCAIFNTAYIEQLVQRHEQGRDLELQLWTLIPFELWCRTFLDSGPRKVAWNIREKRLPFAVERRF